MNVKTILIGCFFLLVSFITSILLFKLVYRAGQEDRMTYNCNVTWNKTTSNTWVVVIRSRSGRESRYAADEQATNAVLLSEMKDIDYAVWALSKPK